MIINRGSAKLQFCDIIIDSEVKMPYNINNGYNDQSKNRNLL